MKDPAVHSAAVPVPDAVPVFSYHPVRLPSPGRPVDLEVRVTAPATGSDLPVLLLSHGHGPSTYVSSLYGYGPLVNFWAAHGFVVVQPTHLDSAFLELREADDPDAPLYLRHRMEDLGLILDNLDQIEKTVPGMTGRLDRSRIAAVGHSAGGHTIGAVSGMTFQDPADGSTLGAVDERIKARVMIAPPGLGTDLGDWATEHYPVLGSSDFAGLAPEALVVAGDKDHHPFFSAREDWRSDAYTMSPSPKTGLVVRDGEHGLGGISAFDASETTDENPERVATVRAMIWAYLRSELYPGDTAWQEAVAALPAALGHVRTR